MESAFRLKIIAGISKDLISIKYNANQAISNGFTSSVLTDTTVFGPKVEIGFGADYRPGRQDDVNFEVVLGLPANEINGTYIYNPTVPHIGPTIAYSHYFGNRDYTGVW